MSAGDNVMIFPILRKEINTKEKVEEMLLEGRTEEARNVKE